MIKTFLKETGIVVTQWIIVAVLVISAVTLYNKAVAADKPIGWAIQDESSNGVTSAYVLGDQGGKLVLTCNPMSNKLEMRYFNGGQREFSFFTARTYMHKFKEKNGSVIVGLATTPTQDVYGFLLNSDTAIEVQPYVDGTKEAVQAAIRRGDDKAPKLTEINDGRETFITTPSVSGVVQGMVKLCPINKPTQTNL